MRLQAGKFVYLVVVLSICYTVKDKNRTGRLTLTADLIFLNFRKTIPACCG